MGALRILEILEPVLGGREDVWAPLTPCLHFRFTSLTTFRLVGQVVIAIITSIESDAADIAFPLFLSVMNSSSLIVAATISVPNEAYSTATFTGEGLLIRVRRGVFHS